MAVEGRERECALPDDGGLGGLEFGAALHAERLAAGRVGRRRDADLELLRQQRRLEVALHHHLHLELIAPVLAHHRNHAAHVCDHSMYERGLHDFAC